MNLVFLVILLILVAVWAMFYQGQSQENFETYPESCQHFCSEQRDRCLQASAPRWCDYSGEFCDRGCKWSADNVFN
jgi:hypothetical protein